MYDKWIFWRNPKACNNNNFIHIKLFSKTTIDWTIYKLCNPKRFFSDDYFSGWYLSGDSQFNGVGIQEFVYFNIHHYNRFRRTLSGDIENRCGDILNFSFSCNRYLNHGDAVLSICKDGYDSDVMGYMNLLLDKNLIKDSKLKEKFSMKDIYGPIQFIDYNNPNWDTNYPIGDFVIVSICVGLQKWIKEMNNYLVMDI